ncbi:hypothetical protein GCM10023194_80980 [Planotetraspora phitsanulokensis]|uniref:Uncharacterized protein n=1 Tax=Planotetraspora phitsanulokensis TaxID=575192 RepID=A0A8J3XNH3_9ACTN|nr:hypothetical protein [Planotetraspora phitsanulokensis]GII42828.1 hypothetical protein Pph01_78310 [Planotetraspora phitsanulokensis]
MSRTTDVQKLVRSEAARLNLRVEKDGDKWKVTNPATDLHVDIPLKAIGDGLHNYRNMIRDLATPAPEPMVAATTTKKAPEMPDTRWDVATLVARARENGVRPYVSGGILHTPGPDAARSYVDMLHRRDAEVIAYLLPDSTPSGETTVPTIADTARIVRPKPRDIAGDAEALHGLLREQAREQGDVQLSNGGVWGVRWVGSLSDFIASNRELFDWDELHEKDVRQYLNRTEHTRCHRSKARPPVWWLANEWNNGGLTVTKLPAAAAAPKPTPKPAPKPTAPSPDPTPPATGGPALTALLAVERQMQTLQRERDEARADAEKWRRERDDLLEVVDEVTAQRDQAVAELASINAVFARLPGGVA